MIHAGGDEDEAVAALLHDVLEDRPGCVEREEIERWFGPRVLEIVDGCSDDLPKGPACRGPRRRDAENWIHRKTHYLAHLTEADPSVLRVSCADKIDNARAIVADLRRHGEAVWSRFNAGRDRQLWYYRGLAQVFRDRRSDLGEGGVWLADELDRQVRLMCQLAEEI